MPRTRAQNEKIREERRGEILAKAIELFARDGFADTGISAVAKAAGVSHGTVFLYFPTKEELLRAAVLDPLREWEARFMAELERDGTPLERIERFVRLQVRHAANGESYMRLVHSILGLRTRFPDLAHEIFGYAARQTAALAPVIAQGQAAGELAPGNPEAIAVNYFAWLNGTTFIFLAPPENPTWEYAIPYAMRLFAPIGREVN